MKCPNLVTSFNKIVHIAFCISLLISISHIVFAQNTDQEERYESLAKYWSPVICQDVCGLNGDYYKDYIYKFDYDDDFDAWNNSENLKQKWNSSSPYVYYWVVETETHYFIGYGIFHPIDWKFMPNEIWHETIWHENDFEGVILCIKKNDTSSGSEGEFMALVSQAHGNLKNYADMDDCDSNGLLFESGENDFMDPNFIEDNVGKHPIVYVESRGHGVYANFTGNAGDIPLPSFLRMSPIFSKMSDWATGLVEAPKFTSKEPGIYKNELVVGLNGEPKLLINTSKRDKPDGLGVIYAYNCTIRCNPKNKEELKNWPTVGYNLVPINDLWDSRYDTSCGVKKDGLYLEYGIFGGINVTKYLNFSLIDITNLIHLEGCSLSAKAPWGWCNEEFDVFMNPASYFARMLNLYGYRDFSQVYVGKSYGTVYETHHPYDRHEIRISWKVPESESLDLIFGRVELDDDTPLYVYAEGILRRVLQNATIRVDDDTFSLNICPKRSNNETLPWGFVLNGVNSVPYLVGGDRIRFYLDENSSINESAFPSKDPDGPSDIKYEISWNESRKTEWVHEIDHTFEDDDMYGSYILVRLSDGLSDSDIYQIPLSVRNVPPSPEICWRKLQDSPNSSENKSVEFAINARDPAGEYDAPYKYSFTLMRHYDYENCDNCSAKDTINGTESMMSELYLNETLKGGTNIAFERCIPVGNYTAAVIVRDDGGASGSTQIPISICDS